MNATYFLFVLISNFFSFLSLLLFTYDTNPSAFGLPSLHIFEFDCFESSLDYRWKVCKLKCMLKEAWTGFWSWKKGLVYAGIQQYTWYTGQRAAYTWLKTRLQVFGRWNRLYTFSVCADIQKTGHQTAYIHEYTLNIYTDFFKGNRPKSLGQISAGPSGENGQKAQTQIFPPFSPLFILYYLTDLDYLMI